MRKALKRFSKSKTTRLITHKGAKSMSAAQRRALKKAIKASAAKRAGRKMAVKAASRTFAKKTVAFSRTRPGNTLKVIGGIYGVEKLTRKKANTKKNRSVNTARLNEASGLLRETINLDAKILASVIKNTGKAALGMQTGAKAKAFIARDVSKGFGVYGAQAAQRRLNTKRAKRNLIKYKKAKSQ